MTSSYAKALFRNLEALRHIRFYKKHPEKWTTRCRSDSLIFRGNIKSHMPSTSSDFFRASAMMKFTWGILTFADNYYDTSYEQGNHLLYSIRSRGTTLALLQGRKEQSFHLPRMIFIGAGALKKPVEVLGLLDFILPLKMALSERQRVFHFQGCFL